MGYITGKIIKELREKQQLTQKELADRINVSDKTISKWETEKGLPDISVIEDLAKALGTSITELLTGDLRKYIWKHEENAFLCMPYLRQHHYLCGTGRLFLLWYYLIRGRS